MSKQSRKEKHEARQEKLHKIADKGPEVQKAGCAMGCLGVIIIAVVAVVLILIL